MNSRSTGAAAALALLLSACLVSGDDPVIVSTVTLTTPRSEIRVGETVRLEVVVLDAGGRIIPDPEVVFRSSRPEVATVDADGVVTGISPGTTTIRAISVRRSDEVEITVLESGPEPTPDPGSG